MSEVHEMKTLTLAGEEFNSFQDQQAREELLKKLPNPKAAAKVGQHLRVQSVDEAGNITGLEPVDANQDSGGNVDQEQIEQVVADYLTENPVSAGITIDDNYIQEHSYKMTWLGELADPVTDYVAWCSAKIYDKNIDKYVVFLRGAPTHMHTTEEFHVVYVDRINMEASEPVRVVLNDAEGNPLTFDIETLFNVHMLDDGTYEGYKQYNDVWYKWISSDHGKTWHIGESFNSPAEGFDDIVTLSNGRMLTMYGGPMFYSDDGGQNWTTVTPETARGDYEAEACFIELKPGVVMAIARYSKAGGEGTEVEPAIVSYSYDYGTTWTKWEMSKTITDMNAIGCCGFVHDGFVELFVMSRWYHWLKVYQSTGKCGAIYHFVATIEDALNDNFTNLGIIKYADGTYQGAAQEFMSATLIRDGYNGGIFTYCDVGENSSCNLRFAKATKDGLFLPVSDATPKSYMAYSSKKIEELRKADTKKMDDFASQMAQLQVYMQQLSKAMAELDPDVVVPEIPDPPGALVWTKEYDASATDAVGLDDETNVFYPYATKQAASSNLKVNTTTEIQTVNLKGSSVSIECTKKNYAIYVKLYRYASTGIGGMVVTIDGVQYYIYINANTNVQINNDIYKPVIPEGATYVIDEYLLVKNGDSVYATVKNGETALIEDLAVKSIGDLSFAVNSDTLTVPTNGVLLVSRIGYALNLIELKTGEWDD